MQFIKRIFFFLLTNIAVLALLSIVMMVINAFFPGILDQAGGMGGIIIYALVIGFGGSFISLLISRWSAKKTYNITLLDRVSAASDAKLILVWEVVERISTAKGINMPEVGYYESAEPNAFATGPSKNKSLVAVSTGLLNTMDKNEIEGVVGHEMAHILNGDMVTMTLIQGVTNTFVILLSQLVAKAVAAFLTRDDEEGEGLSWIAFQGIYMVCQMLFGFLAMFVIMWFSRTREYRADIGGAEFTSKSKMIAGLKRLKKMSELTHTPIGSEKTAEEKKMNAFMINEVDSFFSTHPSLDNRIKALEDNYRLI